jgi:hypothetical protein
MSLKSADRRCYWRCFTYGNIGVASPLVAAETALRMTDISPPICTGTRVFTGQRSVEVRRVLASGSRAIIKAVVIDDPERP